MIHCAHLRLDQVGHGRGRLGSPEVKLDLVDAPGIVLLVSHILLSQLKFSQQKKLAIGYVLSFGMHSGALDAVGPVGQIYGSFF